MAGQIKNRHLPESRDGGHKPRVDCVAKRIESGVCHIKCPTAHEEGQTPFGGVKASGYGRFGGKAVIAEFTDLRWIAIEGPQYYPF